MHEYVHDYGIPPGFYDNVNDPTVRAAYVLFYLPVPPYTSTVVPPSDPDVSGRTEAANDSRFFHLATLYVGDLSVRFVLFIQEASTPTDTEFRLQEEIVTNGFYFDVTP